MAFNSEISMHHLPSNSRRLSFEPKDETQSVNQSSPNNARKPLDFLVPCGPSKSSAWSAWQPDSNARATAEIIQRMPAASENGEYCAPKYVCKNFGKRGILSHCKLLK